MRKFFKIADGYGNPSAWSKWRDDDYYGSTCVLLRWKTLEDTSTYQWVWDDKGCGGGDYETGHALCMKGNFYY